MDLAFSTVGGSPGLSLLYSSLSPSALFLVVSFSRVLRSLSSSPKIARMSSLLLSASASGSMIPSALRKDVSGCFLVLSTLTYRMPWESVSYSSHAPLLGITCELNSFWLDLSVATSK